MGWRALRSDELPVAAHRQAAGCRQYNRFASTASVGVAAEEIGPEDWAVGSQAARTTCGPCQRKGGEDMDEKSSWMRVAITIAIDWRFVTALVILVLALLFR